VQRVNERLNSCGRALDTLEQMVAEPFSVTVRDAAIQRFECSFEVVWKLLKVYLKVFEGVVCNSPKGCFREGYALGLFSQRDTQTLLLMTEDRNLTAHTYVEDVADTIYGRLLSYLEVMRRLFVALQTRIARGET